MKVQWAQHEPGVAPAHGEGGTARSFRSSPSPSKPLCFGYSKFSVIVMMVMMRMQMAHPQLGEGSVKSTR